MYKSLLNDYEARQQSLMVENSELKKVLQQMKRDMMYILSPHKPCAKASPGDDSPERVPSSDWSNPSMIFKNVVVYLQ